MPPTSVLEGVQWLPWPSVMSAGLRHMSVLCCRNTVLPYVLVSWSLSLFTWFQRLCIGFVHATAFAFLYAPGSEAELKRKASALWAVLMLPARTSALVPACTQQRLHRRCPVIDESGLLKSGKPCCRCSFTVGFLFIDIDGCIMSCDVHGHLLKQVQCHNDCCH